MLRPALTGEGNAFTHNIRQNHYEENNEEKKKLMKLWNGDKKVMTIKRYHLPTHALVELPPNRPLSEL